MRRKPNNNFSNNKQGGMRRRFRNDGGGGGHGNNAGKIKSVMANRDKYQSLAREAMLSGDRIEAENYLQHADHYYRVLSQLQEEDNRYRAEREALPADAVAEDGMADMGDDEAGSQSEEEMPEQNRVAAAG